MNIVIEPTVENVTPPLCKVDTGSLPLIDLLKTECRNRGRPRKHQHLDEAATSFAKPADQKEEPIFVDVIKKVEPDVEEDGDGPLPIVDLPKTVGRKRGRPRKDNPPESIVVSSQPNSKSRRIDDDDHYFSNSKRQRRLKIRTRLNEDH